MASLSWGFISCGGKAEQHSDANNQPENNQNEAAKLGFTDFLDEILLGYDLSAIHKYMIHTHYQSLGADNGKLNFEGIDEKKVNHFISFAPNKDDDNQLSSFVYQLKFKNNNENLVMDYQRKIFAQLQEVYGDDFNTGYDNTGFYVVDWHIECCELTLTTGIDFLSVEVKEH